MRIFSGIQPTGRKHLGNYIGAIAQYVSSQERGEGIFCIVDLHAITVAYEPAELRERLYDTTAILLAAGLDPARCILFRQSDVPEHTELTWLLSQRHRAGAAAADAPVPRQVDRPARAGLRRPAALSGAAGRRRARLPRRRGAGRRGPARAPRADARRRAALQRALRRRRGGAGRARAPHPGGRRADHGPAGPDQQDVHDRRLRAGDRVRARRAGGDREEAQERRHRLRQRGPPGAREAGHRQPDRDPRGRPRSRARGGRGGVRRRPLRRLQGGGGGRRGRLPGAGARALRAAARRRGDARGDPRRRRRAARAIASQTLADVRDAHGRRPSGRRCARRPVGTGPIR